jgi:hypothetical protein
MNGTLVSKESADNAYLQLSSLDDIDSVNANKIDVPITLFESENGIDWELVSATIERLKA